MPRARDPNRDKAFEIWKQHNGEKKLKDIASELGVSDTQIRKWKSQDKWEQTKGNVTNPKRNVTNKKDIISWIDIENEYVTDIRRKPCTLEGLSKTYNIPLQTMKEYSAKNGWTEKRDQHRTTTIQKTAEKSAELISEDLSKVTARHFRVSDKLLSAIESALNSEDELYKYVEKLRQGYGKGEFTESIEVEKLDALNEGKVLNFANALEKLQKLQRQSLDILDLKDKHKMEMDRKKLGDEEEEFEDDGFLEALESKVSEVWDDAEEN